MCTPDWIAAVAAAVAAIATVVAVVIALAALVANIIVSKRVYNQTRKFFWTQQINDVVDRFYTPGVLMPERTLRNWRKRLEKEFPIRFARLRDKYVKGTLKDGDNDLKEFTVKEFADLDMGRRLVESYFLRIHQLKVNGKLKDEDIKSYVHDHQVEDLLGILLPMNRAITGKKEPFHRPFKLMYKYYAATYLPAKERAQKELDGLGGVTIYDKIVISKIDDLINWPSSSSN